MHKGTRRNEYDRMETLNNPRKVIISHIITSNKRNIYISDGYMMWGEGDQQKLR